IRVPLSEVALSVLDRTGTSTKLPPVMSVQQARDGALGNWLFHLRLKSLLDLHCRHNFPSGRAGQERLEEGTFLLQRQVVVTPSAFPRRLDGSHSPLLVGGNHPVDRRARHAHYPGNILGVTRSRQRLIDDLPALTPPRTLFTSYSLLDRVRGQMQSGPRGAVSHQTDLPLLSELLSRISF